jgi:hypothetical protein
LVKHRRILADQFDVVHELCPAPFVNYQRSC